MQNEGAGKQPARAEALPKKPNPNINLSHAEHWNPLTTCLAFDPQHSDKILAVKNNYKPNSFPVIQENIVVRDATEQLRNKASGVRTLFNPL